MAKNDFQYGGWNSYTLQCGMWLWNCDSEIMYLVSFLRYSASMNGVTLKLRGTGRSRSLKMAPFDRSYTTFYWSDKL